ncbi:Oidioi.mRNA.OKI2018_I69.YSR.g17134.t1.cds [Oikopleura dioica]|uniref:Oidioi.mRNA.OKI2018_I69.YSR.g17134.t1.cds n=1 Tax=Oikopleura dioica TaxID=34765 RepID=A0ABN7SM33_OIKDI|nr:Oidioi.mRNA.OKI2018_I69.YSR.g17134.t1.cds [Oikopleura dioica]
MNEPWKNLIRESDFCEGCNVAFEDGNPNRARYEGQEKHEKCFRLCLVCLKCVGDGIITTCPGCRTELASDDVVKVECNSTEEKPARRRFSRSSRSSSVSITSWPIKYESFAKK